jgi:very-short-patch-repair endonuclease
MKFALIVIVLIAAAAAAAYYRQRRRLGGGLDVAYRRRDFLSKGERAFFRVLQQAVGRGGLVMAKVRLADLVIPATGVGNQGWQAAFNRISAKHIDFVICGPDDVVPRLAIELDDASHRQATRKERDAFIEDACRSAGLPLLRVPAHRDYAMQELRSQLAEYIDQVPQGPRTQEIKPQKQARPVPRQPELPAEMRIPSCPKCGAVMVPRTGMSGPLAGKEFWGCSTFPRCHGLLAPAEPQP